MAQVNIRGLSKALSAVVVLAVMTGSARAGQDPERNYPLEGTWLAFATQGDLKRPFIDTYTSLQNQHGVRGTVICTLGQGRILLPLGPDGALISVTGTQTGQGSWMRVQKNVYAFTAWRILIDLEGRGWAGRGSGGKSGRMRRTTFSGRSARRSTRWTSSHCRYRRGQCRPKVGAWRLKLSEGAGGPRIERANGMAARGVAAP